MMMEGGLLLRKICGQNECPEYHLCLEQEWQCDPCSKYCEKLSEYYDYKICERHCQDYIHDYIKHYGTADELNEKFGLIDELLTVVVVLFTLNLLMFYFFFKSVSKIYMFDKKMKKMNKNRNTDIQLENIFTEQDPDNDIHVLHDKAVLSKVTVITENSPNVSEIDKEMEEFVEYNNLSVSPVVVHKSDPKPVLDPVID
ncbi:Hypothetical protein CINCED_3A012736 [Cinara cedri]|uniref:Uncharacterized protein n=1 Tax=Cinara cedri TaxID=506608 RepID=A0A5E4ND64_9HEMI|nr:Hypothetical protein CINCED_3A012736 [Cinara cedri]